MPLNKRTPIETWISDFIKSTNPKFEGKDKETRRKMAIAAYQAKQNEDFEDGELVLIEDLLNEKILPQDHPLFNAAKSSSPNQNIHSVKHIGDSSNGKYAHIEVRVKDRTNPNAVRIKKMVIHASSGEPAKSQLSPHLTDVRHLTDSVNEAYRIELHPRHITAGNGHRNLGTSWNAETGTKEAIIMQHKDTKKYFAAGGSSSHPTKNTTFHDTPEEAAKAYHEKETSKSKKISESTHNLSEEPKMKPEDQLDEISNELKTSYAKKAVKDVGGARQLKKTPGLGNDMRSYADTLIKKRLKGLNRAATPVEESETALEEASTEISSPYDPDVTVRKAGKKLDTHTSNRKSFDAIMHIAKNNHAGWYRGDHDSSKYSTSFEDGVEKHHLHGRGGDLLIGKWDHAAKKGSYIAADRPAFNESVDDVQAMLFEADLRGGLDDVHKHLHTALSSYLEKHGNSLDHINSIASILGSKVQVDENRKTAPYTIKKQ